MLEIYALYTQNVLYSLHLYKNECECLSVRVSHFSNLLQEAVVQHNITFWNQVDSVSKVKT